MDEPLSEDNQQHIDELIQEWQRGLLRRVYRGELAMGSWTESPDWSRCRIELLERAISILSKFGDWEIPYEQIGIADQYKWKGTGTTIRIECPQATVYFTTHRSNFRGIVSGIDNDRLKKLFQQLRAEMRAAQKRVKDQSKIEEA